MKNKIIPFLFLLVSFFGYSQKNITWQDLAQVDFTEKYISSYDEYFLYPHFEKPLKELAGQQIAITGYFLNIAPEDNVYILSKTPVASCFFCGAGGPETAMELQFEDKPKFKTDAVVTVSGTFNLNADDVDHFNYILTGCKAQLAH